MTLLKDWFEIEKDVEATSNKVERLFTKWYKTNLTITHGSGRNVEEIFGLPYTSTSDWAGIWNCQAEAYLNSDSQWKFEGLAINDDREVVVVFDREDTGNFDNKFIVIGRI